MARLNEEERARELRGIADDITFNLVPLYTRFCQSAYDSGDLDRLKSLAGFIIRAIQRNDQPTKGYADGDD